MLSNEGRHGTPPKLFLAVWAVLDNYYAYASVTSCRRRCQAAMLPGPAGPAMS